MYISGCNYRNSLSSRVERVQEVNRVSEVGSEWGNCSRTAQSIVVRWKWGSTTAQSIVVRWKRGWKPQRNLKLFYLSYIFRFWTTATLASLAPQQKIKSEEHSIIEMRIKFYKLMTIDDPTIVVEVFSLSFLLKFFLCFWREVVPPKSYPQITEPAEGGGGGLLGYFLISHFSLKFEQCFTCISGKKCIRPGLSFPLLVEKFSSL